MAQKTILLTRLLVVSTTDVEPLRLMDGYRRLALAVILRAVRDMCRHGARNTTAPTDLEHKQATIWLASTRATKWFDLVDMSQGDVLWRSEWPQYAEKLLETAQMTDGQRKVLTEGIERFEALERRREWVG